MKVFADLHHEDLFYSLQLLFEKRLGWELYRPIGLEWFEQKLWAIFPHINTAKQYLDTSHIPPVNIHGVSVVEEHGEGAWINRGNFVSSDGVFIVPDKQHKNGIPHRGITLEKFKDTKFDILLCSIPAHVPIWKKLIADFQPQAKLIFQSGNNFGRIDTPNLLTSSRKTSSTQPDANVIFYHQEFDLDVFKPDPAKKQKQSIINLQHYTSFNAELTNLEQTLGSDWNMKIYGAGNRDGSCPSLKIADEIQRAGFVWHVKSADEGYGYNIHNSFACGTPMIVCCKYQRGMTAELLYEPGKTVIDVEGKSPKQLAIELQQAASEYEKWTENVYNKFKQVVNFDEEFEKIKVFLSNLR